MRKGNTRSHSELGSQAFLRRWYFVLRHGRVGHCQALQHAYFHNRCCWFSRVKPSRLLSQKNYKVSGNDTLVGGEIENVSKDVNFFNIACEDLEGMTKVMKGVDLVCHAAAYAHEGLSSFSPTLICSNNITGSTSVFTAAIKIM